MDPDPYSSIFIVSIVVKPFTTGVAFALLTMFALLAVTVIISSAESAFFSLAPDDLEDLKLSKSSTDKKIVELLARPKRLLATLLVSLNFVNIAIVILSTYVFSQWIEFGSDTVKFVVQVVVVTLLILIIGEIIPKVYAIKKPLATTRLLVLPVLAFEFISYPVSSFLIFSTSLIDKRVKKKGHNISVEELSHALELTSSEDISDEDQKLLKGIVKFGHTDVKQIMKPRLDVTAIDQCISFTELLEVIRSTVYSRIPVYKDSFDQVIGVLYIKDMLAHIGKENVDWQKLVRAPFFVPENKKIDDLLREFQHNKIHLAVVVDEYGGTSGIVTLEDIIEEIVGEINDEFDDDDLVFSKLDDKTFVFEGKITLRDMCRIMDVDGAPFEEKKGESDTLAGFLIEVEGRIPVKNEKIIFNNISFNIEAADNRKIKRIKVNL